MKEMVKMYSRVFLMSVTILTIISQMNFSSAQGFVGDIFGASWSPNGDHIALAGSEGAWIYTVSTNSYLQFSSNIIDDIAWSPQGDQLATVRLEFPAHVIIEIWGVPNPLAPVPQLERTITNNQSDESGRRIHWSPSGDYVFASGEGLHIWNANSGIEIPYFESGTTYVYDVAWSSDESHIIIHYGYPELVRRIFDFSNGNLLQELPTTDRGSVISWKPNSNRIATSEKENIQIWNKTITGLWELEHLLQGNEAGIQELRWADDVLVSYDFETEIRFWNPLAGETIEAIPPRQNYDFQDIAVSYDNKKIAYGSSTGTIEIVPIPNILSCEAAQTISASDVTGLIAAINTANSNPDADVIGLETGTYTFTTAHIPLNALPAITSEMTILGNGATLTRQTGAPLFGFFEVSVGGNLTLDNLTLSGGDVGNDTGGALVNEGGTVTLNNVTFDTFVDWNYPHVSVLYRVQFPLDTNTPAQVWYYVEDNAVVGEKNLRAGIDGFNVELPNDANSDPCKGYVPTVNDPDDPEYDPDFTFTFYYDRKMAAEYGIVQSYNNNAAQRDIARVNMPTTPPFAFFIQGGITHQSGLTGSSVFTSEAIWMGGMPMTKPISEDECTDYGWRHNGDGPLVSWTQHRHIIRYYSDSLAYLSRGTCEQQNNTLIGDRGTILPNAIRDSKGLPIPGGDSALGFHASISRSDFVSGRYISEDDLTRGTLSASSIAVSTFVQCQLARTGLEDWDSAEPCNEDYSRVPQSGDYVLIDSWTQNANGNRTETAHGLLIVGWAKTQSCSDAIMTTFSFNTSNLDAKLYPTLQSAGGFGADVVPYVVDFSHGGGGTGQTQSEIARPFYCTMYIDSSTNFPFEGRFADHEWWFYTLPDTAKITVISLYVNPAWSWEASR